MSESIYPNESGEKRQVHGGRVLLGKLIREGIEPPTFLEPEVLIEGVVHWLFGNAESGKTWQAVWLVKNRIEQQQTVLYLDKENGREIIGERLELLGCDPEAIDEYLYYYEEPDLKLDTDALERYERHLDRIRPALIIFDSVRGFLTSAGLEENSNDDLDRFYEAFLKPVRSRRITAALLDHTPHQGNHARGAGRKKDLADVMWEVKCTLPFDERRVGEVKLKRHKGRRGALPETITFSIGGSKDGFVLRRSEGTVETEDTDGLTNSQHQALKALREAGEHGLTWKEWWDASGIRAKVTFNDAKRALVGRGLSEKRGDRYVSTGGRGTGRYETGTTVPPVHAEYEVRRYGRSERPYLRTSTESQDGTSENDGVKDQEASSFSGKRDSQQSAPSGRAGKEDKDGSEVEPDPDHLSSSLAVVEGGDTPDLENDVGAGTHADDNWRLEDSEVELYKQLRTIMRPEAARAEILRQRKKDEWFTENAAFFRGAS